MIFVVDPTLNSQDINIGHKNSYSNHDSLPFRLDRTIVIEYSSRRGMINRPNTNFRRRIF